MPGSSKSFFNYSIVFTVTLELVFRNTCVDDVIIWIKFYAFTTGSFGLCVSATLSICLESSFRAADFTT